MIYTYIYIYIYIYTSYTYIHINLSFITNALCGRYVGVWRRTFLSNDWYGAKTSLSDPAPVTLFIDELCLWKAPPCRVHHVYPPWSRAEGKSQVKLPQMPPLRGGTFMRFGKKKHLLAPGLPLGRLCFSNYYFRDVFTQSVLYVCIIIRDLHLRNHSINHTGQSPHGRDVFVPPTLPYEIQAHHPTSK